MYLKATEEVLNDTFNAVESIKHTAVSAGSASTVVLAANSKRKYILLVNDSDATIYLNLGGAAAVNTGIRLNANGGSFEISANLGNLYLGAINCVSQAGNKTILVTEGE